MTGFVCYPEYLEPDDPDYDLHDYWDGDEDDEKSFDCGFVPGEGCTLGGTEICDFDCPYRDALINHPSYPNVDFLASDYSF
ncbi:MAG: hypothetical protein HWQ38_24095 [Nostoc sp. NMS7]|uniref:hypothetical protein n=1 Tax=Nostoc sp. NMS7 TaxID=2815391 RepID=UPI0025F0B641|nr:hypothetical protein [Nostoc sp. NMS7]MBN3949375.1 hypothetical protein [Nostoc sp. NMS7]